MMKIPDLAAPPATPTFARSPAPRTAFAEALHHITAHGASPQPASSAAGALAAELDADGPAPGSGPEQSPPSPSAMPQAAGPRQTGVKQATDAIPTLRPERAPPPPNETGAAVALPSPHPALIQILAGTGGAPLLRPSAAREPVPQPSPFFGLARPPSSLLMLPVATAAPTPPQGAAERLSRAARTAEPAPTRGISLPDLPTLDSEQPGASHALDLLSESPSAPLRPPLRVQRLETHFAPIAPAGDLARSAELPTGQKGAIPSVGIVLDQLRPHLGDAAASLATAPAHRAATAVERAATAPVRTLEIALQPATLGALTVTLRLTGSGLKVTIAASERDTADLLAAAKDELSALMESAGYAVTDVEVTASPRARI